MAPEYSEELARVVSIQRCVFPENDTIRDLESVVYREAWQQHEQRQQLYNVQTRKLACEHAELLLEIIACSSLLGLAEGEFWPEGQHQYIQLSHRLAVKLLDSGLRVFHHGEAVAERLNLTSLHQDSAA